LHWHSASLEYFNIFYKAQCHSFLDLGCQTTVLPQINVYYGLINLDGCEKLFVKVLYSEGIVAKVKLPAERVVFQYFRNRFNELPRQQVMMEYELR